VALLEYAGEDRYSGNSRYKAREGRPQAGQEYSLEVTRPGMGTLTAGSRVPEQTPLLSVVWDTLDVRNDPAFTNGEVASGLSIRFADPPEANFYSLSLLVRGYQIGSTLRNGQPELALFETSGWASIQSDDPIVDKPFDTYRAELLFKDVSFNGREYELKLYIRQNPRNGVGESFTDLFTKESAVLRDIDTVYNGRGEIVFRPGTEKITNTLYAVLRTTTEEYYRYHYTRDLQASVEKNPFAQPVQVYNNIANGLGIFAGYYQMEKKITFK
jgi:hypothetical protein